MQANSCEVGFWFNAQSANNKIPSSPYCGVFVTMIKKEETNSVPGAVFKICSAGRNVSAVE